MKKLYFILSATIMLLISSSISAQSIKGNWLGDSQMDAKYGINTSNGSNKFFLSFDAQNATAGVYSTIKKSGLGTIAIKIGIPGSYTQTGNDVKCVFRKNDIKTQISVITLEDPELKALMDSSPDMKDFILDELGKKIEEEESALLNKVKVVGSIFESFKIVNCNASKLVISINNANISFDKVNSI